MMATVAALAVAVPATAFACGGDGKNKEARFQKADKNGDGFLTKAEVGDQRWQRISAADANKDGKVSKAELAQAFKDGKMKRGKGKKSRA